MCRKVGTQTRATVCDHVERHHGNRLKFFRGPFQSLCKSHHDSDKKRSEMLGYDPTLGSDGLPIDPRHPFNIGGEQ